MSCRGNADFLFQTFGGTRYLTIAYSKTPIDKVGVANPGVFDARLVGMCRGLIQCLAAQGLFVPRHNKHNKSYGEFRRELFFVNSKSPLLLAFAAHHEHEVGVECGNARSGERWWSGQLLRLSPSLRSSSYANKSRVCISGRHSTCTAVYSVPCRNVRVYGGCLGSKQR